MRLTLTHARVVDPADGSVTDDVDVVIEGSTITAVGRGAARPDATGIDVSGKYVIPGLNEMHSHVLNEPRNDAGLELMLAHGITGFRQMAGSPALLKDRAAGRLGFAADAPDLLATPGDLLLPFNAGTPGAAVTQVRAQYEQGADFIKIGIVPPPALAAAQEEAKRLGIPVVGHLPSAVDVPLTSRLGFRSVEHLGPGAAMVACSSEGEAIRAELRANAMAKGPARVPPKVLVPLIRKAAAKQLQRIVANPLAAADPVEIGLIARARETFDEGRARALAEQFVTDGTWQCPTLIRMKAQAFADTDEFLSGADTTYVSERALAFWKQMAERFAAQPAELRDAFRSNYAMLPRILEIFADTGVRLLSGSDSGGGATGLVVGAALHREFAELAAAGLTPLQILQGATSNVRDFLDIPDLGRVAPTFRADLVVLDANPLAHVANLGAIAGVVKSGRWIGREGIDGIRSRIAAARAIG